MAPDPDPYKTLGVSPGVSDAELRAAYRHAVLRDHPDHNGGSVESARRFEAVQDAYARIRRLRERPGAGPSTSAPAPGSTGSDSGVEARLAEMERELAADRAARERAANAARQREQARRRAREAAQADGGKRPTDEELGYIKTDDSFSKIFSDAVSDLSERLDAPEHHVPKRLSDLIDELESKLGGGHSDR